MTSGLVLRYATFLSAFDYEVDFKKGSENIDADCLSRAPVTQNKTSSDMSINNEINQACMTLTKDISTILLNADSITKETNSDAELLKLKQEIQLNPELSYEHTLKDRILFKGQRVIIPKSLQKYVLSELHRAHIGITQMKQPARRYVYSGVGA